MSQFYFILSAKVNVNYYQESPGHDEGKANPQFRKEVRAIYRVRLWHAFLFNELIYLEAM